MHIPTDVVQESSQQCGMASNVRYTLSLVSSVTRTDIVEKFDALVNVPADLVLVMALNKATIQEITESLNQLLECVLMCLGKERENGRDGGRSIGDKLPNRAISPL